MRWWLAILLSLISTPAFAQQIAQSNTVVIALRGEIDDYNKSALIKHFAQARRMGVGTVILDINTYGGSALSGLEISKFLKQQNDLHVIAYVDEKAISAGAMISLACDEIVMQPGSLLGDCAPIMVDEQGIRSLAPTERAKMESPILADFNDSARRNHYDPLLAESMVRIGNVLHYVQNSSGEKRFVNDETFTQLKSQGFSPVVGVPDPVQDAQTLLTVGPELAVQLGLAKSIERSITSLAGSRSLIVVATLAPPPGQAIIALLNSTAVRGILTTIFLFTLYTALGSPGHGAAEVVMVSSLAVLIGVPLLTGYAQWWEILCILAGITLLALEFFVIPGFGITGIGGIILLLIGLVMIGVGEEPMGGSGFLPQLPQTWASLRQGAAIVVGGMICSLLLWGWLQRYLPRLPYLNRLILQSTNNSSAAAVDVSPQVGWPVIGAQGRAVTDLRPGGRAAFFDSEINNERLVNVVSDSGYVQANAIITVREVGSNRVLVRAADVV